MELKALSFDKSSRSLIQYENVIILGTFCRVNQDSDGWSM